MAYPVKGKGHGGNRLICRPQGDSPSLSFFSSFLSSLFPLHLAVSAQPRTGSLSHRHPHLPPAALSPGFQSEGQMKLLRGVKLINH